MKGKLNFRFLLSLIVGIIATLGAVAQDVITVKGQVMLDSGEPAAAVAVQQVGTTNGTITDMDGNFSMKVPAGTVLKFTYLGYESQEAAATDGMTVTLVSNDKLLEDVVVIGYGVAKKNDLTGSVTAIKPDEKNRGLVTNPQDMISGKIAGVNISSTSGTPGAGATIRIRGGSSLNASNDPIIVIDGLAMDNDGVKGLSNPLSIVNPADIETFTVLKDASATAIYGSRGSNGVIIITTKKGLKGGMKAPKFTYNGSVSLSMKKDLIEVMDGDEFRSFIEKQYGTDSEAYAALGKANTDWQDEIYRPALSTDHNVTAVGGMEHMGWRASLGYTGQEGILKTSDFRRMTASLNLTPSLLEDHLTFNINLRGMYAKTQYADDGAVGAAVWFDPTQSPTDDREEFKNFDGYFQWLLDGSYNDNTWTKVRNELATKNPVALLDQQEKIAKSKSFIGNIEGTYKIHNFEDLILHANLGADVSTGKETSDITNHSATNPYYGWNGWESIDKYNLSFNAFAQYTKDFNKANHFDIMAGYEWQHFHHVKEKDGSGWYPTTNNDSALRGTQYKRDQKTEKSENYLVSFFGRANYSLLNRYLLTATLRYDGSSRFKDHWALFPSFAFGWKLKEEAFLRDVDVLTDAKIRLGYGQTGQQEGIGDYNYFASFNVNTGNGSAYPLNSVGDGTGTLNRPDAYNADLTWETTTTYNAGLDLDFLNGRFSLAADYYYRETTDLLNTAYVSAGSNFRNQVTSNIGKLENRGIELALTVRPIQTGDWNWELSGNATYNKNEITELIGEEGYFVATGGISSGVGKNCQAHSVGHAANSFYVYQQVYDVDGQPIEGLYVDRNADGIINESDKYFYKSPTAPWLFGLSSRLQYKNWDFGFSLRANVGNYVYNDLEAGASNVSKASVYGSSYLSNRPKMVLDKNWQTNDNALSDYFVQNGSFLKCDNITLGYSFGDTTTKLSGRVFGSVTNVFCVTNYKGIDPEIAPQDNGKKYGIDNNIYPRPITYQLGLTLNF